MRRPIGLGVILKGVPGVLLIVTGSACMTYRGPTGVQDALEQALGTRLHREAGIKLGPISTRFVASFVDDGDDPIFHDLSRIGVAVFEVGASNGCTPRPLTATDLGVAGWSTLLDARDDGGQALVLVKPNHGSIHDLMLVTADSDEVVFARLSGRLDHLISSVMEGSKQGGVEGVRRAVSLPAH